MHKTLIALATAAAFAGAGIALPSRAEAQAWWVIPAIVAAGVGTVVVATAVAARDDTRPYEPRGVVQVRRNLRTRQQRPRADLGHRAQDPRASGVLGRLRGGPA